LKEWLRMYSAIFSWSSPLVFSIASPKTCIRA
jgi:hypothetical protein